LTTGFDWDEKSYPYSDPRNTETQMVATNDWMKFVLERPLQSDPGTEWVYNTGSVHLLSGIIKRVSGMYADEFAEQTLFQPLGISDYEWQKLPNNVLYTSGDLKLQPRDMAKLGDLFLHGGSWKGTQIISEGWVEESTKSFISASPNWVNWDYGYKWWLYTYEFNSEQIETFSASGWGGQKIFVIQGLDMVVVTTAGYYDEPQSEFHIELMLLNILSSVL